MKTMLHAVKGMAILFALVLAFGTICAPIQAKSKGYVFKYKKVSVSMHGKAKKIIKKAGKPSATKVKKSCAYKGKDRTYKYKDFILYTYSHTDDGEEFVNGITFLTSTVSTPQGIKIGSTLDDVIKKYGKAKDKFGVYTYKKGKTKLQIEVTDDVVSNIRYIPTKA